MSQAVLLCSPCPIARLDLQAVAHTALAGGIHASGSSNEETAASSDTQHSPLSAPQAQPWQQQVVPLMCERAGSCHGVIVSLTLEAASGAKVTSQAGGSGWRGQQGSCTSIHDGLHFLPEPWLLAQEEQVGPWQAGVRWGATRAHALQTE